MKTSLEFSKKLKEAGFEKETKNHYYYNYDLEKWVFSSLDKKEIMLFCTDNDLVIPEFFNSYDILNDLCVTYAADIFGENILSKVEVSYEIEVTDLILRMMQLGDSQEDIELYIWNNCILNKDNK